MNRVSSKTAARNRRYLEERERYLRGHPRCEHAFEGICATWSNQIDHRVPRGLAPGCHNHRTNDLTREERQDLGLGIYAEPALADILPFRPRTIDCVEVEDTRTSQVVRDPQVDAAPPQRARTNPQP